MSNYLSNSQLIPSKTDYEIYSFGIVDNLYNLLQYNQINEIHLDFDYNVITLQGKDNNRQLFNISFNDIDSTNLFDNAVDGNKAQNLVQVERNTGQLINMGLINNEKINVKDNKEIDSAMWPKNNIKDSQQDLLTCTFPVNRKRVSESMLNGTKESGAKKPLLDQNTDNNDDFGLRSKTQPKVLSSFPLKKKIDALNELQAGKSIQEVSELFRISEKAIRDFQINEKEIRLQFREVMLDTDSNSSHKEGPLQPQSNTDKGIALQQNFISKSVSNSVNKLPMNIQRKNHQNPPQLSKLTLNLDFEIHKENGKISFGKMLKNFSLNFQTLSFKFPNNHPDFPKPSLEKRNLITPVSKPFPNDSNRTSNLIPKVRPEQQRSSAHEMSVQKPVVKPFVKSSEITNKFVKKEFTRIEPVSLSASRTIVPPPTEKKSDSEIKIVQHYPTDPIVKIETKPVLKKKSSTNKYEPPNKIQSPFRYLIIDPLTVDFKPEENVDPELKSTNIDSEEFINEVRDSYERFTVCLKFYDKYNLKREELRNRACATQNNQEISELYREFYQLVEEEKMPFFLNLEKEVTVLHSKLCKVANLMGIKLA